MNNSDPGLGECPSMRGEPAPAGLPPRADGGTATGPGQDCDEPPRGPGTDEPLSPAGGADPDDENGTYVPL